MDSWHCVNSPFPSYTTIADFDGKEIFTRTYDLNKGGREYGHVTLFSIALQAADCSLFYMFLCFSPFFPSFGKITKRPRGATSFPGLFP